MRHWWDLALAIVFFAIAGLALLGRMHPENRAFDYAIAGFVGISGVRRLVEFVNAESERRSGT